MDIKEIYPHAKYVPAKNIETRDVETGVNEIYPSMPKNKSTFVDGLDEKKHPLPKMNPRRKVVGIKEEECGLVVGSLKDGVKDLTKVLSKVKVSGNGVLLYLKDGVCSY